MVRQKRIDHGPKLGDYLLAENIHAADLLGNALEQQSKLKKEGIFKPLGVIIRETIGPSPELDRAIERMQRDVMASSPLFKDLPDEPIAGTLENSEHRIVPENTILLQKGERLDTVFFVISGKVKAYLTDKQGGEITVATLKSGDTFAETVLCGDQYAGVSMKSLEPTSLLLFSKEYFNRLRDVYPELSTALLRCLANKLRMGYEDLAGASEWEQDLRGYISRRDAPCLPELLGQTPLINKLRKAVIAAAAHQQPVLITGEAGTEKEACALMLHNHGSDATSPFLTMNAEEISLDGYSGAVLDGSDLFRMEMAQCSELFGRCPGTMPLAKSKRLGLLSIAHSGTIYIENIEKLTHGACKALYSYLTTKQFTPVGGRNPYQSQCRIVAGTRIDLQLMARAGKFHPGLADLLGPNTLQIPPLRKRKGDLLLLVDFLIIKECFKGAHRKIIQGISPASYRRIMEYDWPGNMEELEIVIRRAINLTKSEHLMPEDIFLGMAPPKGKYTYNLLQLDVVQKLFTHRFYPGAIQVLTGLFFSTIILSGILGHHSPEHNISVYLVWALWWPLLTLSWFLGARIWCSLCPMGALNDLINRFFSPGRRKVPAFIRDKGVYLSAVSLLFITWGETASLMPSSPFATAILLLSIGSAVAVSALIFQRRVWCRHLCPLGRMAGVFSGCSLIEWRSNSSICNSACSDHYCYTGRNGTAGCPMLQGPFALSSNQNCILCGNCLKTCENNSPTLNLRMPGHELWAAIKPDAVTSFFVPVIIASQLVRGGEDAARTLLPPDRPELAWPLFGALLLLASGGAFALVRLGGHVTFPELKDSTIKKHHLFSHGLIPLLFVYELAFQLGPLLERLGHTPTVLGNQLGIDLKFLEFGLSRAGVLPLQELSLLAGTTTSVVFTTLLARKHCREAYRPSLLRYMPLILLGSLYMWIFT